MSGIQIEHLKMWAAAFRAWDKYKRETPTDVQKADMQKQLDAAKAFKTQRWLERQRAIAAASESAHDRG